MHIWKTDLLSVFCAALFFGGGGGGVGGGSWGGMG